MIGRFDRSPMFVMTLCRRRLKPGRKREPVAVLELREDAKAGQQLLLTQRDLAFLTTGAELLEKRRDA